LQASRTTTNVGEAVLACGVADVVAAAEFA
jgi:hypothetical protein